LENDIDPKSGLFSLWLGLWCNSRVCHYASGVSFYEKNFKIIPEKFVTGHYGQGNLDYAIECCSTNRIIG